MSFPDLTSVDDSTAALILQMQMEELELLESSHKGKARIDQPSDADLALHLYMQELKRWNTLMTDRAMTRSIGSAVMADGPLLAACEAQERLATQDHETARHLGGLEAFTDDVPANDDDDLTDDILHKLRHIYVSPVDGDGEVEPSSSRVSGKGPSSSSSSSSAASSQHIECEVCREHKLFFDIARLPCGHQYCRGCLQQLFEASIIDESLFPPRCCRQPIIMKLVRPFLMSDVVKKFVARRKELETLNRTYCCSPTCSLFIPPNLIVDDRATCRTCGIVTCVICKSESHHGDCPNDSALQDLLRVTEENGWQRCYACHRIVELDIGCNHMTCRCGAEFCYKCGERWKLCLCDQWDENRLLARANQIVDRRDGGNNQPRARQVEEAVHHLRQNHNCAHPAWWYIRGPQDCEECRHQLSAYIFRCRQCRIQICHRCMRNRL